MWNLMVCSKIYKVSYFTIVGSKILLKIASCQHVFKFMLQTKLNTKLSKHVKVLHSHIRSHVEWIER